ISSYKQLPIILYQIQTKFRDEIRPKYGIIRSREFIMKDAYSFHMNSSSLLKTYKTMHETYLRIFKRMNLQFCVIKADSSVMGGKISHEFQTFSKYGENTIVTSKKSNYATNIEMFKINKDTVPNVFKEKKIIKNITTEKDIAPLKLIDQDSCLKNKFVKTLLVKSSIGSKYPWIILLIRDDHKINLFKIKKIKNIQQPFTIASDHEIKSILGQESSSLGPIGLSFPIITDITVSKMKNFTVKANINDKLFTNVNWNRDLPAPIVADIRNITKDEILHNKKNDHLEIKNCIEIAHIFQIGNDYSKKLNAFIKNKAGISYPVYMGCYGIGISRIIAAIIEQNHDNRGIIWPDSVSPFQICILPINMYKSLKVKEISEYIYETLKQKKIDVLFDDRQEQPGNMFAEIELIGIPHYIIISDRHILTDHVEYRNRRSNKSLLLHHKHIISFILKILKSKQKV
ncbi:proline--tRNA ligase, partial [Buchnera aphidicola (Hormaphis cornu)]